MVYHAASLPALSTELMVQAPLTASGATLYMPYEGMAGRPAFKLTPHRSLACSSDPFKHPARSGLSLLRRRYTFMRPLAVSYAQSVMPVCGACLMRDTPRPRYRERHPSSAAMVWMATSTEL